MSLDSFTLEDLEIAISQLKKGKASGLDDVPNELLFLDTTNKLTLLKHQSVFSYQTNALLMDPFGCHSYLQEG